MKKAIIICAMSVAALAATAAVFIFRKCKEKKPMKFYELYEDNAPSKCPLRGSELCCEYEERILSDFGRIQK